MNAINSALAVILAFSPTYAHADDGFFVFPTVIAAKMASYGGDKANPNLSKVRDAICSGSKARLNPKVQFEVKYPDTQGMIIDDAAKFKADRMKQVRDFLKYYYFQSVSGDLDKEADPEPFVETVGKPEYASDLGLLRAAFTFKIPREVIETVFKGYGDLNKKSFGYDYHSGQFSARQAIDNRDWVWQKVLASQTIVKQAPTKNNSVKFNVELDMSMFCAFSIPITDLISQ